MNFLEQLIGDLAALPVTLVAEAINGTIKVVEAAPAAAERAFERIEDAFARIGR